jgi:P27 family predicted phage terminase small subunit
MATRGKRPKSNVVKLLQGQRVRTSKRAPRVPAGTPEPPEHLNKEAKAVWAKVAPKLYAAGLLTELDREALGALCCCAARVAEAERHLAAEGPTVVGARGAMRQSPWLSIAAAARRQMLSLAQEFGMTPSSRGRIKAGEPPAVRDDDFDDLLNT